MAADVFSKLRPALLGKMTQRLVIEAIQARGPLSRADITRHTGISPTTVSNAVAGLLGTNMLEEGELQTPALGRPGKLLHLAARGAQVIGAVVDAISCQVVAAALDGHIHADRNRTFPTPATYAELLDGLATHAAALVARPGVVTLGIGLSLPGLIDNRRDQAVFSPNLHQTDGKRPSLDLKQRLGLETTLLHEPDALCLAERCYGGAKGLDDCAVIDFVTGLGLGILVDGQLLKSRAGLPGELGHITVVPDGELCGCGNRGCLETMVTDAAVARAVSRRVGRRLDIDDVFRLTAAKKLDPRPELETMLDYLAVGLAALINLYCPEVVFLHGRSLDLVPDALTKLAERTKARALGPLFGRCRVLRAQGTKAQGAVAGVLDHLVNSLGPKLPASMS